MRSSEKSCLVADLTRNGEDEWCESIGLCQNSILRCRRALCSTFMFALKPAETCCTCTCSRGERYAKLRSPASASSTIITALLHKQAFRSKDPRLGTHCRMHLSPSLRRIRVCRKKRETSFWAGLLKKCRTGSEQNSRRTRATTR
jgi:hypothetical protein